MAVLRVSEHKFQGQEQDVCVFIREVMEERYGLYVWPCSVALAEHVWQSRGRYGRCQVVELGAGTGLAGIVAAKVGARVTLTDRGDLHEVLDNLRKTCELNKVRCTIRGLTWGDFGAVSAAYGGKEKKPDLVLGADVVYDSNQLDDLFATVSYILEDNPGAKFVTTYQRRSGHRCIEYWMAKWGLQVTSMVDVASFMPLHKLTGMSCSVDLVEIQCIASSFANVANSS